VARRRMMFDLGEFRAGGYTVPSSSGDELPEVLLSLCLSIN
jgi:Cu2+-containing amine oxidase